MAETGVEAKGPSGSVRNWLIGGLLVVTAAIIFGLLYLFVIAPSVPNGSIGWYLFSFATGLTMIVMPCTLPLAFVIVPLSMGKGMIKGISMALSFGLGVAFTLSLYGIAAALLGGLALGALGTDLETLKNWVYFGAGIFALIFALSEIGLMNFHMPTYSGAAPAFIQKRQEILKAFFLGAFLGNVGVGCPHPATPLILIEIATSGDVLYGWTMFLIHAVGRVLPLLLLAFLAILGVNGLNWLMARKDAVERATGWAMVFVAGFILTLGLFSHKWWVNSGIHNGLEAITQESSLNALLNDTLGTAVAHVHGIETGTGLFGLPLAWGSWFLVFLWLFPIWWWYAKRRKSLTESPAFKMRALEAKIDRLEKDRRQVESMVKLDDIETSYDLAKTYTEIDELERLRRLEESKAEYGETGVYKNPVAREYELKILGMQRNYLILVSFFLAVIFIYYIPTNFALKSMSGTAEHHAATPAGTGAVSTAPVFSTDTANLPLAHDPEVVTLENGATYAMSASYVQKRVGNTTLRMLAYNGSVPGPFINVKQGGEITLVFTNNTDIDQTVHSHGLRLDNNFDGTPGVTQNVVKPGETFTYTLKFPDAGIAWYHPHTRDDYGQEMGLYGNYFVDSTTEGYNNPVNRTIPFVIDDILLENGKIAPFYKDYVDHALLGRFGNLYLINGEPDYAISVKKGEVVRVLMTNVSNARTYRLSVPGALIKKVGADLSKFESEAFVEEVIISPAERLVLEMYFKDSGTYKFMNRMSDGTEEISRFIVEDEMIGVSHQDSFLAARKDIGLTSEFDAIRTQFDRVPDKKLKLTVQLNGAVNHDAHAHTPTTAAAAAPTAVSSDGHDHGAMATTPAVTTAAPSTAIETIQWNDPTNSDSVNTTANVQWLIVDEQTGKQGMNIPLSDWTFKQGQMLKIRITNDSMAAHVMQHPIHLHGQRFVVLSENGVLNKNMAWKDTTMVLPGEYIDIIVDMSNTGEWMLHCHISEHLHAGMMMPFRVEDQNGYANGDEYRKANVPATTGTQPVSTETAATQAYTWSTPVSNAHAITLDKPKYKVSSPEYLSFSFTDSAGAPVMLDSARQVPISVTFVNQSGSDHFTSFPGNTAIHQKMMQPNIPGTPGFNEAMPHGHSFNLVETAHADTGHAHTPGEMPAGFAPTYSIPAYFATEGKYKAFVEYYLAGDAKPFIGVIEFEVGPAAWSVDNYGWSKEFKWWTLFLISLILIVPLSLWVYRYINKKA